MAATGQRIHHLMFSQSPARRLNGQVILPGYHNGNLRAYGALVPGSVVVMPDDDRVDPDIAVPLDSNLEALLLPGFTHGDTLRRGWSYLQARAMIRDAVKRADFVYIQFPGSFSLMGAKIAADLGKTMYADAHGSLVDPPGRRTPRPWRAHLMRSLYYKSAARKLAGAIKLLIAVSPHLHDTFPPTAAAKVVAPCTLIDEEAIYPRDNACAEAPIELFVATRMIQSKGIHHLIEAVKILREEGRSVRLRLAGVGEYVPQLKQLTADLNQQDAVDFLGGLPAGDALWTEFRRSDISVLPSLGHYEGTPRQIIEAWAAGSPVVSTTVGGIPAMVNTEQDGLLVPPGDVPALVAAIKRVCDDAELRRRLIAHGYDRVQAMTFEARVPILRDAFQKYLPGLLPEAKA